MADYKLGQSKSGEEREGGGEGKERGGEGKRERGRDRVRQQRQENRLFSIVGLWLLKSARRRYKRKQLFIEIYIYKFGQ